MSDFINMMSGEDSSYGGPSDNTANNIDTVIRTMTNEVDIITNKIVDNRKLLREQELVRENLINIRNKPYNNLTMDEKRILLEEITREVRYDNMRLERLKKEQENE